LHELTRIQTRQNPAIGRRDENDVEMNLGTVKDWAWTRVTSQFSQLKKKSCVNTWDPFTDSEGREYDNIIN
jgi:hypothetical protein